MLRKSSVAEFRKAYRKRFNSKQNMANAEKQLSAEELIKEGIKYYTGKGVKRKYSTAVGFFRDAAQTNPIGKLWYAKCKYFGNGKIYDPVSAYSLFSEAAESNIIEAKYYQALCLFSGAGVDYNEKEAFNIFKQLSKEYLPALHHLGLCYYSGLGTPRDFEKSLEIFKLATEKQYFLSELYYVSMITGPEKQSAHEKLRSHAEQVISNDDNDIEQFEYGKFLKFIDTNQGLSLITKAAMNHNRDAQCYLGKIYYGVEKWSIASDFHKAFKNFKKASDHGSFEGMYYYGLFKLYYPAYEKNDNITGAALVKLASEHRIIEAKFTYANLLLHGIGVQKDEKSAVELYKQLADFGHTNALIKHCKLRAYGQGIEKNVQEAAQLLKNAAGRGIRKAAIEYIDLLKSGLIEDCNSQTILSYYLKAGATIDLSVEPIKIPKHDIYGRIPANPFKSSPF